jgi:hypothetical protein
MSHQLKVGQAVVQAFRELDRSLTYQIVRLMPPCSQGEPQYLIRCRIRGLLEEGCLFPTDPARSQAACAWPG